MTHHYTDITKQLPLGQLSSDEVSIILSGISKSSSTNPEEPHIVYYGGDFKVTYKSGTRTILKIAVSTKFWSTSKSNILDEFEQSVSPSEEQIYSRVVFNGGEDLNIPPFRWGNLFQLGRVPDGNPKTSELWALYPCLFQYKIPITGNLRLDAFRGQDIFRQTFLPLIPLLKQYCTTDLQYNGSSSLRKAWALTGMDAIIESQWVQLDYLLKVPVSRESFHTYSEVETKQLPTHNLDPSWLSSSNVSLGYAAYENLSHEDKNLFLLGCEWLNKAITASEKTDSFLFVMIMLEIFLPNDSEPCDSCGQRKYGISKKFKTFIPEVIGADWISDFESVLGKLYSLRCKIAHSGVAIGQYSSGLVPLELKEDDQLIYSFDLARQFLVSWLFLKSNIHNNQSEA